MTVENERNLVPSERNADRNYSNLALISPPSSEIKLEKPLQLGIMASGSGTNFEAVAEAIASSKLHAEIKVLIYNNPKAKVRSRAENWNVPTIFVETHGAYKVRRRPPHTAPRHGASLHQHKRREDCDRQIVEILREYNVEWVVMAGWMRVVTNVLLDAFPNKIINIHPSLLPSFKGIRAVEQAFAAGVKITGCTVHFVSLEVDSGAIILQAAVPVLEDDTAETLHARIQVQEHRILPQAIAIAATRFG